MLKNKLKDHREIAREMDLFSFHEYAPGAIFWHPKGLKIYHILEDFIRKKTENEGYREISTPVIVKSELFKKSGHWQHFGENIFMNCSASFGALKIIFLSFSSNSNFCLNKKS